MGEERFRPHDADAVEVGEKGESANENHHRPALLGGARGEWRIRNVRHSRTYLGAQRTSCEFVSAGNGLQCGPYDIRVADAFHCDLCGNFPEESAQACGLHKGAWA